MTNAVDKALPLIEEFEGFRDQAYWDAAGGVWTIGYGRTGHVRRGMHTTRAAEEAWTRSRITHDVQMVDEWTHYTLNDNQLAALASFVYNLGAGALHHSTLLRYIMIGRIDSAADEFPKWVHAGGHILPGLTRRREAERKLFES